MKNTAVSREVDMRRVREQVRKGTASKIDLIKFRHQEAQDRMKHHPNGHLGWLLNFLKRDLDEVREGEWTDLAFDVLIFPLGRSDFGSAWNFDEKGPAKEEVRQFHEKMREYLNQISSGKICQFTIQKTTCQPWVDPEKNSLEIIYRGHPYDSLVVTALAILRESWSRLRRCHNCQTWFLMSGRKEYCSTQCSQQVRWQRFLAKNPKRRKKHS